MVQWAIYTYKLVIPGLFQFLEGKTETKNVDPVFQ